MAKKCALYLTAYMGAFVFAIIGIKDICIAFSHWKMPESKKPEISDIFDIYRIIIDEIAPSKRKKQLVLIDDLDRISDKKAVITFLKELYRFQDSIAEDKHQFVFVISIKPESNLTDSSDRDEGIFSKIFDTTVYFKPIHFDDYDSILLEMIKADSNKHKALEELSGEEIDGVLPESFKWIKRGSNLTIRDLKERLNQAVSIMVSLVNKSYEGNSAASFQACAAVSYLENHFPKDYYRLIRKEVEFADFMKKSLPIIDRQSGHGIDELRTVFKESFQNESFSTEFIAELCSMIIGEIFNDDFRMYFYTYPKGSHIKTTYEKEICDYLLFPNLNNNYELLAEAVSHSYKNSTNDSVEATIRALSNYPMALLKNDILYLHAAAVSLDKLFSAFNKKCIEMVDFEDNDLDIWKRVLLLDEIKYSAFSQKIIKSIVSKSNDNIVVFRRKLILALADKVVDFKDLFVGEGLPVITSEEVKIINNPVISLQLIDEKKLALDNYEYISQEIVATPLINKCNAVFNTAMGILGKYSSIIGEEVSDVTIQFLKINKYRDDKAFVFCCAHVEEEKLVDYINEFTASEFSDVYLNEIDRCCIRNGLSNELIDSLLKKDLFATALLHFVNQSRLYGFALFESKSNLILEVCKSINTADSDAIVELRKEAYLSRRIEEYSELYFSPYPVITPEEYENVQQAEVVINLIDTTRIAENDYNIVEIVQNRSYSEKELEILFERLFDKNNSASVLDPEIREELVERLDFGRLNLKKLTFEKREQIYELISDAVSISKEDAIEFQKRMGGFIPTLEKQVQKNEQYSEMIEYFDELSEVTLQWLDDHYISCKLSEKLCQILYEREDYRNYIIASTLRNNSMIIDGTIPVEDYIAVYRNSESMFDIMSNHWEFLELFEQYADLSKFDYDHLIPAFRPKQYGRFFTFIDGMKDERKIEYFGSFGKIASLEDSKKFRRMICKSENIELLGNWEIYYHVREQLWDDAPQDKAQFTRVWNQRWKNELTTSNDSIAD